MRAGWLNSLFICFCRAKRRSARRSWRRVRRWSAPARWSLRNCRWKRRVWARRTSGPASRTSSSTRLSTRIWPICARSLCRCLIYRLSCPVSRYQTIPSGSLQDPLKIHWKMLCRRLDEQMMILGCSRWSSLVKTKRASKNCSGCWIR